jgi:hypothetical protein
MGRVQAHQPLLGNQGYRALVAPRDEGRQQTFWPGSRFVLARIGIRGLSDAVSPSGMSGWALSFGFVRGLGRGASTFLHPLAPPELPGFNATTGALTPVRRFFASPLRLATVFTAAVSDDERRLVRTGLSASCAWPSDHSVSNHREGPLIALTRYPSASRAAGSRRFGLRHLPAGSPPFPAESSSLALRTGHSPCVVSHPASRRRGYGRLQAGERLLEEDLHLPDLAHSQTHRLGSVLGPHTQQLKARYLDKRSHRARSGMPHASPSGPRSPSTLSHNSRHRAGGARTASHSPSSSPTG